MNAVPEHGHYDAVIVGGGFFGCEIALALRHRGMKRVAVAEREHAIMTRASYVNQARVHNGYHYPRALLTAASSHRRFAQFRIDYGFAIDDRFQKIYAIATQSRVNLNQFERFCDEIGIPCWPAPNCVTRLFDSDLVAASYLVEEVAFDTRRIAEKMYGRLEAAGVELLLKTEACIVALGDGDPAITLNGRMVICGQVFNCTYAELEQLCPHLSGAIKKEVAEIALIRPPLELTNLGVTVMDGPFFSTMPFPAEAVHSLSHVRYTPHAAWVAPGEWPEWGTPAALGALPSHANSMIRDATRYLPCMRKAEWVGSLIDIKAVLVANEDNDGRPILLDRHPANSRVYSVLGGKIDNIYDLLEMIDELDLT